MASPRWPGLPRPPGEAGQRRYLIASASDNGVNVTVDHADGDYELSGT